MGLKSSRLSALKQGADWLKEIGLYIAIFSAPDPQILRKCSIIIGLDQVNSFHAVSYYYLRRIEAPTYGVPGGQG